MVVGIDWYDNIDNEHSGARFYRSEIRESEALATKRLMNLFCFSGTAFDHDFFAEARERFAKNDEMFNAFVRENHERFAQMMATRGPHGHQARLTLQDRLGSGTASPRETTPSGGFPNHLATNSSPSPVTCSSVSQASSLPQRSPSLNTPNNQSGKFILMLIYSQRM